MLSYEGQVSADTYVGIFKDLVAAGMSKQAAGVAVRQVQVQADVDSELARQMTKWNVQDHDQILWLSILGEEFGEVARAVLEARMSDRENVGAKAIDLRAELVQVAAVAIAAIENLDRRVSERRAI